jgi:hypothetical protein
MKRLEFSCFTDFLVRIFKRGWFSLKSASRRDCEKHGAKDSSLFLKLMSKNTISGICVCGTGLGTFIIAPVEQWTLEHLGWRSCLVLLAGTFSPVTQGSKPVFSYKKLRVFFLKEKTIWGLAVKNCKKGINSVINRVKD